MENKNTFERREMYFKTEVRAVQGDEGEKVISGVIPYGKNSCDMGFIEVIKPGAFNKTLKEGDVRALWSHDTKMILARQSTGGLILEDRADGLHFEIKVPESRGFALDAFDVVQSGDADGVSFGFRTRKDTWIDEEGEPLKRELNEVELFEVSVGVTFPAYPDSKAATRAIDEYTGFDVTNLARIMIRSKISGITAEDKTVLGEFINEIRNTMEESTESEQAESHSEVEQAKTTLIRAKLDLLEKSI